MAAREERGAMSSNFPRVDVLRIVTLILVQFVKHLTTSVVTTSAVTNFPSSKS